MANTIKLKRSSVQSKTPQTTDLELGEIAINTYDGKVFIKKDDGTESIVEVTGSGSGITDVIQDTSPQAGGNFDLNGHNLVDDTGNKLKIGDSSITGSPNARQLEILTDWTTVEDGNRNYGQRAVSYITLSASPGNGTRIRGFSDETNIELDGYDSTQDQWYNAIAHKWNAGALDNTGTANPSVSRYNTNLYYSVVNNDVAVTDHYGLISVNNADGTASVTNSIAFGAEWSAFGSGTITNKYVLKCADADADLDIAGTITTGAITLPNTDGTNGQMLQTDGSGNLTWTTPAGGATEIGQLNDVDMITTAPVNGKVLKYNGTEWVPGDGSSFTGDLAGNDLKDTVDQYGHVNTDGPITINYAASDWVGLRLLQENNTSGGWQTAIRVQKDNISDLGSTGQHRLQLKYNGNTDGTGTATPNYTWGWYHDYRGYNTSTQTWYQFNDNPILVDPGWFDNAGNTFNAQKIHFGYGISGQPAAEATYTFTNDETMWYNLLNSAGKPHRIITAVLGDGVTTGTFASSSDWDDLFDTTAAHNLIGTYWEMDVLYEFESTSSASTNTISNAIPVNQSPVILGSTPSWINTSTKTASLVKGDAHLIKFRAYDGRFTMEFSDWTL